MAHAPEPPFEELLWTIAVARLLFGPSMNIQAPPNLTSGRSSSISQLASKHHECHICVSDFAASLYPVSLWFLHVGCLKSEHDCRTFSDQPSKTLCGISSTVHSHLQG